MKDLSIHRSPYVPTVRQARRFATVLASVAAVFGAIWWSGLVALRMALVSTDAGSYDNPSGRATVDVELHNKSLRAIEVRDVTFDGASATVASVLVNGHDVATGYRRIADGETAKLHRVLTCRPAEDYKGIERSRATGKVSLPPACRR